MPQLISPNKVPIIGLLETIPGTALVSGWERNADGTLEPTYAGGTTVYWDDQTPGKRSDWIAVDEDGGSWSFDSCIEIPDDDCATCAASIETRSFPCDECGTLDEEE